MRHNFYKENITCRELLKQLSKLSDRQLSRPVYVDDWKTLTQAASVAIGTIKKATSKKQPKKCFMIVLDTRPSKV